MAYSCGLSLLLSLTAAMLTSQQPISDQCSTEQLVEGLSVDQLAALVSKWAIKHKMTTWRLLEQLDRSLADSNQVERRFLPSPIGLPPPFAMGHPHPDFRFTQPLGIPPPPANAVVRMRDVEPVEVTVSPRMTVADALRQAAAKLADSGRAHDIVWRMNKRRRCHVIRSVGGLTVTTHRRWTVDVTSGSSQMWRDVCLPTLNEIQIRPGYVISVQYVSRDQLN